MNNTIFLNTNKPLVFNSNSRYDKDYKGKITKRSTGGVIGSTLSGAGTGAAIGSAFSPIGTAVGAVVGAAVGFGTGFYAHKQEQKAIKAKNQYVADSMQRQRSTIDQNRMSEYGDEYGYNNYSLYSKGGKVGNYKCGGKVKKKALGGELEDDRYVKPLPKVYTAEERKAMYEAQQAKIKESKTKKDNTKNNIDKLIIPEYVPQFSPPVLPDIPTYPKPSSIEEYRNNYQLGILPKAVTDKGYRLETKNGKFVAVKDKTVFDKTMGVVGAALDAPFAIMANQYNPYGAITDIKSTYNNPAPVIAANVATAGVGETIIPLASKVASKSAKYVYPKVKEGFKKIGDVLTDNSEYVAKKNLVNRYVTQAEGNKGHISIGRMYYNDVIKPNPKFNYNSSTEWLKDSRFTLKDLETNLKSYAKEYVKGRKVKYSTLGDDDLKSLQRRAAAVEYRNQIAKANAEKGIIRQGDFKTKQLSMKLDFPKAKFAFKNVVSDEPIIPTETNIFNPNQTVIDFYEPTPFKAPLEQTELPLKFKTVKPTKTAKVTLNSGKTVRVVKSETKPLDLNFEPTVTPNYKNQPEFAFKKPLSAWKPKPIVGKPDVTPKIKLENKPEIVKGAFKPDVEYIPVNSKNKDIINNPIFKEFYYKSIKGTRRDKGFKEFIDRLVDNKYYKDKVINDYSYGRFAKGGMIPTVNTNSSTKRIGYGIEVNTNKKGTDKIKARVNNTPVYLDNKEVVVQYNGQPVVISQDLGEANKYRNELKMGGNPKLIADKYAIRAMKLNPNPSNNKWGGGGVDSWKYYENPNYIQSPIYSSRYYRNPLPASGLTSYLASPNASYERLNMNPTTVNNINNIGSSDIAYIKPDNTVPITSNIPKTSFASKFNSSGTGQFLANNGANIGSGLSYLGNTISNVAAYSSMLKQQYPQYISSKYVPADLNINRALYDRQINDVKSSSRQLSNTILNNSASSNSALAKIGAVKSRELDNLGDIYAAESTERLRLKDSNNQQLNRLNYLNDENWNINKLGQYNDTISKINTGLALTGSTLTQADNIITNIRKDKYQSEMFDAYAKMYKLNINPNANSNEILDAFMKQLQGQLTNNKTV